MRVYVDCLVGGIDRYSEGFYGGSWDKCKEAAHIVAARVRTDEDISYQISAQRPGLIRIVLDRERLIDEIVDPCTEIIQAVLIVDTLIEGVAHILTIELDS
jgi:hypothetical protein